MAEPDVAAAAEATDAARDAFTDGLAHDLRGPLTAVRLALSALCRGDESPATQRRCERALRALQRADDLIENLLDVSHVHAGRHLPVHMADVDLVPAMRQVVRESRDTFARPIRFVHEANVRGCFDLRLVARALQNLVHNAVAYGTPGVPVEVKLVRQCLPDAAAPAQLQNASTASARPAGQQGTAAPVQAMLCLQVSNHGPPVRAEELAGLLGRFARGGQASALQGRNWGLGLMVVEAVAAAHGGTLSCSSAEGVTSFCLCLPLAARAAGRTR